MIFYKQRKMIVELYNDWLKETNALNCGESFIAFLQISGWLNEEDIMQYFDYYTAPKATCENCEYSEKTSDVDLYYCKKYQNIHYDNFYCAEGCLKDEHDVGSIAVEIKDDTPTEKIDISTETLKDQLKEVVDNLMRWI